MSVHVLRMRGRPYERAGGITDVVARIAVTPQDGGIDTAGLPDSWPELLSTSLDLRLI
jgi:hypothetical protein